MHRNEDRWGESGEETERLVYFSDAVFAIAITLLVIDIRVPEMPAHAPVEEQIRQLLELWPKVLSYAISFLVVGSFWMAHHRIFGYLKRYDGRLIGLNLLLLLCVAFVPVPTAVLGDMGGELVPVVFYAGCIALTALARGTRPRAPDHCLQCMAFGLRGADFRPIDRRRLLEPRDSDGLLGADQSWSGRSLHASSTVAPTHHGTPALYGARTRDTYAHHRCTLVAKATPRQGI